MDGGLLMNYDAHRYDHNNLEVKKAEAMAHNTLQADQYRIWNSGPYSCLTGSQASNKPTLRGDRGSWKPAHAIQLKASSHN